jgi:glyoxylase-like metal-dependent hydrolase (beta-lactamase superfamily II)
MISVKKFVFNAFQVNSYVLYDETGECIIIDPSVSNEDEFSQLDDFIKSKQLTPVLLVNTHAHIDHIIGNYKTAKHYKIKLAAHKECVGFLEHAREYAESFGLPMEGVKKIDYFVDEGQKITFGNSCLMVFYTPGHADCSICLYSKDDAFVITGDVLFYQSIGRTDLRTGNYDLLQKSIWEKLFTLPDNTKVYAGHGPDTTIGYEKVNNPFVAIGME